MIQSHDREAVEDHEIRSDVLTSGHPINALSPALTAPALARPPWPSHGAVVASDNRSPYIVSVQQHLDLIRREQVAQAFIRKGHSNRALIALWIMRPPSRSGSVAKLVTGGAAALIALHHAGMI